jgi:hypothetical protein
MCHAVLAGASNQLLSHCYPFELNIQKGGKKLSNNESQVLARLTKLVYYQVNAGDVEKKLPRRDMKDLVP